MNSFSPACMSALPPKADIGTQSRNVCFVPKADKVHRSKMGLFDYLVSDAEQSRREAEAECLGGFEVDHQLEFSWLQNWQIGGLLAFKNPADIYADLSVRVGGACVIAHQATGYDNVASCVHRWDRMAR